jgi:hypothetical protein
MNPKIPAVGCLSMFSTAARAAGLALAAGHRHSVFVAIFALGVALRVIAQITYWPAMWNADSHDYFHTAYTLWIDDIRPSGFGFFMHLVPGWTALWPVAVVQHLLGLAAGAGIYLVLRRWDLPRWGAALAAAPLLVDPLQIDLEQFMLADVLTELLIVGACLALLARRTINLRQAAVAGALLGLAGTVRTVATPLVVIAAIWTLLAATRRWRTTLALVVAFAVPFGAYVVAYHHQRGSFTTTSWGSLFLYDRIGLYIDCNHLRLPAYEQALCPSGIPVRDRTTSLFLWQPNALARVYAPPPGRSVNSVVADFNRRALTQQPLAYAWVVVRDTLRGFQPTRSIGSDDDFDRQWRLGSHLWVNRVTPEAKRLLASGVTPRLNRAGARILTAYQNHVAVPGPALGLSLVAALLCLAGIGNARRRTDARFAAGGVAFIALATMVIPAATASFSWRYQISAIALLPVAAAIGITALVRRPPLTAEADPATLAAAIGSQPTGLDPVSREPA